MELSHILHVFPEPGFGRGLRCCLMFLLGYTTAKSSAARWNSLTLRQFSRYVANECEKLTRVDF